MFGQSLHEAKRGGRHNCSPRAFLANALLFAPVGRSLMDGRIHRFSSYEILHSEKGLSGLSSLSSLRIGRSVGTLSGQVAMWAAPSGELFDQFVLAFELSEGDLSRRHVICL